MKRETRRCNRAAEGVSRHVAWTCISARGEIRKEEEETRGKRGANEGHGHKEEEACGRPSELAAQLRFARQAA